MPLVASRAMAVSRLQLCAHPACSAWRDRANRRPLLPASMYVNLEFDPRAPACSGHIYCVVARVGCLPVAGVLERSSGHPRSASGHRYQRIFVLILFELNMTGRVSTCHGPVCVVSAIPRITQNSSMRYQRARTASWQLPATSHTVRMPGKFPPVVLPACEWL